MSPVNPGNTRDSGNQGRRTHVNRTLTILIKEFREVFRDRRTVISVVISPLLITPALFAVMGLIISSENKKESKRTYDVGIVGGLSSPDLARAIGQLPQISVRSVSRSEAELDIAAKRLNAALILPSETERLAHSYRPVPVEVLLDAGDESSQAASKRLSAGLTQIGEHVITTRLSEKSLPPDFATPFTITETPIKAGGNVTSLLLATMLPYLLVVSSFGGAIYASFDQVAGEKERGTLETLLVSPASRREIVLGKFGAVAAVCLLSSILSVVGVVVSFSLPGSALALISRGGLHLSAAAIGISILMMLPLAVLFAGVLLAVSTFARNQKEAQTYITPILLFVMIPVMVSVFVRSDVPKYMALIPILGTSIIIKQAFNSVFDPSFIFLAFGSSVIYGGLAVLLSTSLFEKESVLIKA